MALVFPIFLFFVMGMIEFGRAYWTLNSMQYAVDEAGRYAMLNVAASDSQIVSVAKSNLNGLNSSQFNISSSSQTSNGVIYKVIKATYSFTFITPILLPFGNMTLKRSTTVPLT